MIGAVMVRRGLPADGMFIFAISWPTTVGISEIVRLPCEWGPREFGAIEPQVRDVWLASNLVMLVDAAVLVHYRTRLEPY